MARCRKSYEEQLNVLDEQIMKAQDKLNNLKEQREMILSRKREEELSELYQVMQERELSVEDILCMIQGEEEQTA